MRATLRITWLLLSLSFLFDGICSDDTQTNSTTQQPPGTTVKATTQPPAGTMAGTAGAVLTTNKPTEAATATAAPANADPNTGTQKPTGPSDPQQTFTVTKPVTAAAATTKLTPAQPQLTTSKPDQITLPASSDAPSTVVPGTTVTQAPTTVKNTTPLVSTSGGGSTGPIPNPATAKTPGHQTTLPAEPGSQKTSATVKGGTNPPTPEAGGRTPAAFTPTTSQADSRGGTKGTLPPGQGPTTDKTTAAAGNPETTTTTKLQTKPPVTVSTKAGTLPPQITTIVTTSSSTSALTKKFTYSLLSEQETKEEEDLAKVCKLLMPNWLNGTCTLTWRHHNGKVQFDLVEINGKVKTSQAAQYYEEITKKPTNNTTLIAILASCGALLIMIIILAVCATHHRKPYHENQQHLTEELHTVENGYHDNPTLEVEVQPEMQEKKVALNGEFNDSWIVPIDNLLKEDLPDEEDTHL
ncbi:podocalyxin [Salarias fasciatus]|uniref:Podocalyxin n=1 Tax=Salarias fasciatus TaxID=181472 RepID=A0A672IPJ0_SALFA|nr:podocalyxin [Salarias fasciatus]XP_029969168.1 podocalyxin [Salarias fasciatus]